MLSFEEYMLFSSLNEMDKNVENMIMNEGISSHIGKLAIITSLLSPLAQADVKDNNCDITKIQQIYSNYNIFQSKYKDVISNITTVTNNIHSGKETEDGVLDSLWDNIEGFQQKGVQLNKSIDDAIKNPKCNNVELKNKLINIKNNTNQAINSFEIEDNLSAEDKWKKLTGEEFPTE